MVTVGQRGEALHVHSQEARERICLSVTELWKFPGGVLHGTVPLAELYAGERAGAPGAAHWACRGREAVPGQGPHQRGGALLPVLARLGELGGVPLLELAHALLDEPGDCALAGLLREEAQRLGREVVVVGLEGLVARLAHDVGPGWPTPAAVPGDGLTPGDEVELDEVVEVAADRRRRQAELLGKSARSDGAVLADRLQDAVARARLEDVRLCRSVLALTSGDKHNMNVT